LVTCRPRRLTLDRIDIAKAEFDAMLRDGRAPCPENSWSSALHIVTSTKVGVPTVSTEH
jgi:hypothetical protein